MQWFAKLASELTSQGFHQSKYDYSLFIKHSGTHTTYAAVYVDDIILTSSNFSQLLSSSSIFILPLALKIWVSCITS